MADQAQSDYIGAGLLANRPTTPNPPSGGSAFYYATDNSTLYVWDPTGGGSVGAWDTVASGGGGSAAAISRASGGSSVTHETIANCVQWSTVDVDDLSVFDFSSVGDPVIATIPSALNGKLIRIAALLAPDNISDDGDNIVEYDDGSSLGWVTIGNSIVTIRSIRRYAMITTRLVLVSTGDRFRCRVATADGSYSYNSVSYFQVEGPF